MEKFFKLKEHGTTISTEIIAGLTTFFTMAYIIFVNPTILGAGYGSPANMPDLAVVTTTCLAAAIGTWLIGLLTNYPLAQAPGMGLNAVFAYTLCGTMGLSYSAALSAVFLGGIFFIILTITGARKAIVDAIPMPLKKAISAGIGMFIALIGLYSCGLLSSDMGTIIAMNTLAVPTTILALIGLIITIILVVKKVPGSLFISIVATSIIGAIAQFGLGFEMGLTAPTSFAIAVDFSTFGAFIGGFGELFAAPFASLITVLVTLLLVDMFDTIGTLIGTANKADLLDEDGNLPKVEKALLADAVATSAGAVLGTSTVTTYVESSAGVSAGGRTGLTSMVTGTAFLLALFLSPLLGFIPGAATAPVLVVVGVMMSSSLKEIDWADMEIAIPCFITVLGMPLFYSISDGLGFGFIAYVVIKLATGKAKEVHPVMYVVVALFLLKYILSAVAI
ncbi:MAG: NCS2 family permease [Clostridia bacterium]